MLDGYQPGDPVVAVFAYQADPGRSAQEIAAEAFDIFNDYPRDAAGAELACAYYQRRLRSLSFPRKGAVLPEDMLRPPQFRVVRMAVDPASWRASNADRGTAGSRRSCRQNRQRARTSPGRMSS